MNVHVRVDKAGGSKEAWMMREMLVLVWKDKEVWATYRQFESSLSLEKFPDVDVTSWSAWTGWLGRSISMLYESITMLVLWILNY